jgi:hypothetical protein
LQDGLQRDEDENSQRRLSGSRAQSNTPSGGRAGRLFLSLGFLEKLSGTAGLDLEVEVVPCDRHRHLVSRLNRTSEHHPRELVLDEALDRPSEGAGAELRVVPLASEQPDGLLVELDLDPLRAQPPCDAFDQELCDLRQLLVGQRPEDE